MKAKSDEEDASAQLTWRQSLLQKHKEDLLMPYACCLCSSRISFFVEMKFVFKASAQNGLSFITKLFSYR